MATARDDGVLDVYPGISAFADQVLWPAACTDQSSLPCVGLLMSPRNQTATAFPLGDTAPTMAPDGGAVEFGGVRSVGVGQLAAPSAFLATRGFDALEVPLLTM